MINLDIIIEALEMVDDESTQFFDRETQDTVLLSPYTDDYEELAEAIENDFNDRYIRLPSRYEINEYGMMEDFIDDLPDGEQKYTLSMAINGRGAFRRFKDTVIRFGLDKQWYAFRDRQYANLARRWCEENDVEYYQKGAGVALEQLLEDIAEDEPVNVVKIDIPTDIEEALIGVFPDAIIEHINGDNVEEREKSLTPGQVIKLLVLHKHILDLQNEIGRLAIEVPGDIRSALNDVSRSMSDAVKHLQNISDVIILMDDDEAGSLAELVHMLRKLKERKRGT